MNMKNKTNQPSGNSTKDSTARQNGNSVVVQWQWHCSGSCHAASNSIQIFKNVEKQQSTSSDSTNKPSQASQHCIGTMMTASPSWHNGGMHCSNSCHPTSDGEWNDTLKNNNQPARGNLCQPARQWQHCHGKVGVALWQLLHILSNVVDLKKGNC